MAKRANPYLLAIFSAYFTVILRQRYFGSCRSNTMTCFAKEGQSVPTFTYRQYFSLSQLPFQLPFQLAFQLPLLVTLLVTFLVTFLSPFIYLFSYLLVTFQLSFQLVFQLPFQLPFIYLFSYHCVRIFSVLTSKLRKRRIIFVCAYVQF